MEADQQPCSSQDDQRVSKAVLRETLDAAISSRALMPIAAMLLAFIACALFLPA